jgi:3',5'-cyclic AMP phosphodiesterase CpdA
VGGCTRNSAQGSWLQAELTANPRDCTLAMWHHPRFSSGILGDQGATVDLWQLLYEAGGDLVLSGHDHMYERFAAQTLAAWRVSAGSVNSWWHRRRVNVPSVRSPTARSRTGRPMAC